VGHIAVSIRGLEEVEPISNMHLATTATTAASQTYSFKLTNHPTANAPQQSIMNLDRQSLGIIISRVLGIYVLVQAIDYFPMIPMYLRDFEADFLARFPLALGFLMILGLSYFLLAHASRVSRFLMSETQEGHTSGAVDADSVIRTAFFIIGGFLLVRAIPSLIGQVALYYQDTLVGPAAVANILQSGAQLLLGLFLVIGGGSWNSLLRKLRS